MAKELKKSHGWLLFGGCMVAVFLLGLLVSSLMERRAEVASVFNNKRTEFTDSIIAQNEKFKADYPREYETWAMTEDTTFKSMYNSSQEVDVLEQRPEMVILWAGYAFSRHYNTPRGHKHALEDMRKILRTGNPGIDGDADMQPATCWTCKGPDVPRMMRELGTGEFYHKRWSELGNEIMNTIGCSDCHDARTMDLKPARPALYEAWARAGKDVKKASHQELRSLVCAQCHTEYYFIKNDDPKNPGKGDYLMFPQDKGMTCEAAEEYYDSIGFYDYIHPLSKTPILKAQHPGYEIALQGIHGQRGVACADCHMPYKQDGGVKFTDHHIMSPLANIDRTCQICHRQDAEVLRQNVYERQAKCNEVRDRAEKELAAAHIEAKFAFEKGATDAEMKPIQDLIRKSQWRWDYAIASHGATFHSPQEVTRLLSHSVDFAQQARLKISKVLAKHGFIGDVPMPDISTKAKAQAYIGLNMSELKTKKQKFLDNIVPKWIEDAKKKGKLIEI
ncbi:MAG: ammonia-forming cytochrome c nitrite reductase [Muribaculaceae bacterium]|nr:ammonia-forming cytochrome c nitrite reductase [Muribaculaceae bacterium]